MDFDDRVEGLIVGCLIGFIFGYISRILREIKDELDEVKSKVEDVDCTVNQHHPNPRKKNEDGIARHPILLDFVLLLVVVMTAFAAFKSQSASNDIKEAQRRDNVIIECVLAHLEQTTTALNQNTQFSTKAAQANVDLQRAQAQFLHIVMSPASSESAEDDALRDYVETLTDFVAVHAKAESRYKAYPYPTREQLANCLAS